MEPDSVPPSTSEFWGTESPRDPARPAIPNDQPLLATLDRFNTCRDHVRAYIQWKYGTEDIDIKKLDFDFVADLELPCLYAF